MAMISCSECGNPVSTTAAACPHCGAPVGVARPRGTSPWTIIGWVLVGCIVLLMYGCYEALKPRLDPRQSAAAEETMPLLSEPPAPAYVVNLVNFACRRSPGGMAFGEGVIQNTGTEAIPYVEMKVAFVDKNGEVLGYGSGMADSSPLFPGQKSTFKALGPDLAFDTCAIEQANSSHGATVSIR